MTQSQVATKRGSVAHDSTQTAQLNSGRLDGSWIIPAVLALVIYKFYEPNFTPEAKAQREQEGIRRAQQDRDWNEAMEDRLRQERWEQDLAKSRE